MYRALSTAATGMEGQQSKIDVVANNLANVNTVGFKKSRANFADLLYETMLPPGGAAAEGRQIPSGIQIGHGSRLVDTQKSFSPGKMTQTGNPLDLAVEGDGFFQVSLPDGRLGYTRAGAFRTDSQGRMTTPDGNLLEPSIVLPSDATQVTVGKDGTISVTLAGQTQPTQVGRLQLTAFANPGGLQALGNNVYIETAASGPPRQGNPGAEGFGALSQGFLELSNVKVVEEMIELIVAQRAYESNSRVIKAADEMLRATAHLK
jgi:flagellar basal-body rod protein FlgG